MKPVFEGHPKHQAKVVFRELVIGQGFIYQLIWRGMFQKSCPKKGGGM